MELTTIYSGISPGRNCTCSGSAGICHKFTSVDNKLRKSFRTFVKSDRTLSCNCRVCICSCGGSSVCTTIHGHFSSCSIFNTCIICSGACGLCSLDIKTVSSVVVGGFSICCDGFSYRINRHVRQLHITQQQSTIGSRSGCSRINAIRSATLAYCIYRGIFNLRYRIGLCQRVISTHDVDSVRRCCGSR